MNNAQKKKLLSAYGVKREVYTMPGGEKFGMTELSSKVRAGYLAVMDKDEDDKTNYIVFHGFDDFDDGDYDVVAAMSESIKQDMMMAVLKLSDLLADDDAEEVVEEKKKP